MNYLKKHLLKIVHFKLAFPVVLGMITTMIYNLADTMFVAKTGNTDLVAGVTIGAPLFTFLIAVSDIFGLGGSSLIVGIILTVLLLVFAKPILILLGVKASTYSYAFDFYRIIALGLVFIIFSLVPQNLIRTEGLAFEAMLSTMIGTILAIILH